MKRRQSMKVAAVSALVLLAVAIGGAASAFWKGGTGTGSGRTGTTVAATLTPGSVSGDLFPGGSATVRTTASNPNAGTVRIESLVLDTTQGTAGFSVDAAHSGCPTSSFTFAAQNNAGTGWTLPANGSLPISMPGALTMTQTAANACQGVVVTVFVRVAS